LKTTRWSWFLGYQIEVLDKGKIDEVGNHEELIQKKGNYYNLVKNQLELGS